MVVGVADSHSGNAATRALLKTATAVERANGDVGQTTLNNIVTNSQRVMRDNTAQKLPDPDDRVILNPAYATTTL